MAKARPPARAGRPWAGLPPDCPAPLEDLIVWLRALMRDNGVVLADLRGYSASFVSRQLNGGQLPDLLLVEAIVRRCCAARDVDLMLLAARELHAAARTAVAKRRRRAGDEELPAVAQRQLAILREQNDGLRFMQDLLTRMSGLIAQRLAQVTLERDRLAEAQARISRRAARIRKEIRLVGRLAGRWRLVLVVLGEEPVGSSSSPPRHWPEEALLADTGRVLDRVDAQLGTFHLERAPAGVLPGLLVRALLWRARVGVLGVLLLATASAVAPAVPADAAAELARVFGRDALPFVLVSDRDGGRVALERDVSDDGVAVVASAGRTGVWELVRGGRDLAGGEIRAAGKVFRCLGVRGGDKTAAGAVVEQGDCDGHPHQQWRLSALRGAVRVVNAHSGLCLTGGGAVVQAPCDEADRAQRWRVAAAGRVRPVDISGQSYSLDGPQPLPEEFAGGGRDKPCAPGPGGRPYDLPPGVVWRPRAATEPWKGEWLPQEAGPAFGPALFKGTGEGVGRASLVQVLHPDGENLYYFARATAKVSVDRLRLALQWTPRYEGGPGGWHTCSLDIAGRPLAQTLALPRTPPGFTKGAGQVIKFRVCLTYTPEMTSLTGRYTVCTGRW
ncbi:RICIN domain-containing protein [Nonomuraea typhae]|uniref:RICIN domain-containing protein n=1 Tax=Nonomuraea typhae TaxID=2603600 RepID=A0ABW7Z0R7_9ACTN